MNTQNSRMAPYFPLYISRSDGRLETLSVKSKKKESNAPSEAQLNANREVNGKKDFYKSIEVGDAKEVDWRRKLGGMLMREIGDKEHAGKHTKINVQSQNINKFRTKIYSRGHARELPAI